MCGPKIIEIARQDTKTLIRGQGTMTIGEGIFWSTIISVIFISILLITKNKKWKQFFKISLSLLATGVIIAIGIWMYSIYEERPQLMATLNKVTLGMSEVDVTLAKGEPAKRLTFGKEGDKRIMLIFGDLKGAFKYTIIRKVSELMVVTDICDVGGYSNVLGFSEYSSEASILDKLGTPTNVSINEKGTEKILSYPQWNAAFGVEKGLVNKVCLTSRQDIRFVTEYKKP